MERPLDVVVLTDCPNPARTEGLIQAARATGAVILNIDHHPDNRRYGDVDWIDTSAAATGEMVYRLVTALGAPLTPAIAMNLFTGTSYKAKAYRENVRTRDAQAACAQCGVTIAIPSPPQDATDPATGNTTTLDGWLEPAQPIVAAASTP